MASDNKVSKADVAEYFNRIYGTSWSTFTWGEYHWDDSALAGSGAIDHVMDAIGPSGYDDYIGGIGFHDDLRIDGINVTPSGDWIPKVLPGEYYIGNERYYQFREKVRSTLPANAYTISMSGVNPAHPLSIFDPVQTELLASGSYQAGILGNRAEECNLTHIRKNTADTNFNAANVNEVGSTGSTNIRRLLVKYPNLIGPGDGQIPSNARIEKAELTLFVDNDNMASGRYTFPYQVLKPWTPEGATWNKYDGVNTWETAGGEADIDYIGNPDDDAGYNFPISGTYFTFNVASGVQNWADGKPNNGWILANTNDDDLSAGGIPDIASEIYPDTEKRPHLSVVWVNEDGGHGTPQYTKQGTLLYSYPIDSDIFPPIRGVYRQRPDWSAMSGVHPQLENGESSENDRVWEPSGGQFWLNTPDWLEIPASGIREEVSTAAHIRVSHNEDLYVEYDNIDASGNYINLENQLNINPTDSFMYHNKMLVLTDNVASSGILTLHRPNTHSVQHGEIIHLIGSFTTETGAPIHGAQISVNVENAKDHNGNNSGSFLSQELEVVGAIENNSKLQTQEDGTVHYRFRLGTIRDYNTPISFQLEARDFDISSEWIDVDYALTILS
jgi:hypothetical protein